MPPQLGLGPILGRGRKVGRRQLSSNRPLSSSSSICLICSLSFSPKRTAQTALRTRPTARTKPQLPPPACITSRRAQSTDSNHHKSPPPTSSPPSPTDPRKALAQALRDLQAHAPHYVNASRLQLALRNLDERAGNESIRVAVWALGDGTGSSAVTAKKLVRLVLADPLLPEQEWERQLDAYDGSSPLVVHVDNRAQATSSLQGESERGGEPFTFTGSDGGALPEVTASCPALGATRLELVLMVAGLVPPTPGGNDSPVLLEEAVLAPTIEISASGTGAAPAPVHRALLVGDGILGAASAVALSPSLLALQQDRDLVSAAVNFRNLDPDTWTAEDEALARDLFSRVDIAKAAEALALFRASVGNALAYETLWDSSNVGAVTAWLKAGVVSTGDEAATKPAVRHLIRSLLQNATATVDADEARRLSVALSEKLAAGESPSASPIAGLENALVNWAQAAHEELQEQLDIAFTGRRWRRLGWWKLFWRVDDVGGIASDMVALRFLPVAERQLIYLAGRIRGAGVLGEERPGRPTYAGPVLAPITVQAGGDAPTGITSATTETATDAAPPVPTPELEGMWPTHIPYTRNYIQAQSIPALQALAQRLVAESLGTTALTTALGALTYLSALGGMYEAGSVAALGLVWSLRRLQTRWETARQYWEGEVREEGRKAVRATEASIAEALDRAFGSSGGNARGDRDGDLARARELVQRVEDALARLN